MSGLTSLFVTRDGSLNGTTPMGARHALGGLLTPSGGSLLEVRKGVLIDNGDENVVTGTADMSYDVRAAAFVGQSSVAQGPWEGVNDSTYNIATDPAPGSNSRYDVVWVRQHLVAGDGGTDTDVILEIGVTQGLEAASPVVPSDGGGANEVPNGAVRLANILVTSGMTATDTATITQVFDWTVARGGVLPIRTSTERDAITTPYVGQTIYYTPDDALQVWDGAAWQPVGPVTTAWTAPTLLNSWVNHSPGSIRETRYRKVGDVVEIEGSIKSGSVAAIFNLPSGFRPAQTMYFNVNAGPAGGLCMIFIEPDGDVNVAAYAAGGANTHVALNGVRFSTL